MKTPLMPLWALVGPTAAGKSALAQQVALALGCEIISVDAVQVYRGFDIGSAKPSAQERLAVPHHGIDVVGPTEVFNAQHFVDLAERSIREIRGRGHIPLLCGGTGLYLRALRFGLVEAPTDAALRAQLIAEDACAPGTSARRLAELDPASSATIDGRNTTYVRRALEICLLTGETAHALRTRHQATGVRNDVRLVVVDRDDAGLRTRIAARTEAMLAHGLKDEVVRHLDAGVPADCRPMQAVGYREMTACVKGHMTATEVPKRIVASTWSYVRRQRIWLRREARMDPAAVIAVPQGSFAAQVRWLTSMWPRPSPPQPRPIATAAAPAATASATTGTKTAKG